MWQDKKKGPQGAFGHATDVSGRLSASYRYRPPNKYEARAAHRSCSQIVRDRHAIVSRGRQETLNGGSGEDSAPERLVHGRRVGAVLAQGRRKPPRADMPNSVQIQMSV